MMRVPSPSDKDGYLDFGHYVVNGKVALVSLIPAAFTQPVSLMAIHGVRPLGIMTTRRDLDEESMALVYIYLLMLALGFGIVGGTCFFLLYGLT
ncbi:hypothetical protein SLE2022_243010 [Rubroshorea leprosula]